jgi:hypothetical protein
LKRRKETEVALRGTQVIVLGVLAMRVVVLVG